MAPIEQLLCTHCTFGTSALETATAENASKVLGYSVRASSIRDRTRLRNEFRAVERLLSYELPIDSTADHRRQLDANTAPVRLCYVPDIAGRQVIGQVAFRRFDTANRPGSYFAHLLVGASAQPWPVLDCLRMWGLSDPSGCKGWARSDTEDGFPNIEPLLSLAQWLNPEQCWISDSAVSDFLQTGTCLHNTPPGKYIPSRWASHTSAADRIELVARILQSLLENTTLPSVVLAAEPAVATVCFYAALRLMPENLRNGVGFSTYEPEPTRAIVRLAATTFCRTEADFKPQVYDRDSLVLNTFRGPPFESGAYKPCVGAYAQWALQRLARGEVTRIDEIFQSIQRIWGETAPSLAELDQLPHLEALRVRLFRHEAVRLPAEMTEATRCFLADRCSRTIQTHMTELTQLPLEKTRTLVRNLEVLFRALPREWEKLKRHPDFAAWLHNAQPTDEAGVLGKLAQPSSMLSDTDAVRLIATCDSVAKEGRLPRVSPGSKRLWGEPDTLAADAGYVVQPLLMQALQAIPPGRLTRILPRPLPNLQAVRAFVLSLKAEVDSLDEPRGNSGEYSRMRAHLRVVLDDVAGRRGENGAEGSGMSDADFQAFLQAAEACRFHYDPTPGAFGSRLSQFILNFRHRVAEVCVDDRLITLAELWVNCASDHVALRHYLHGWKTILSWFANNWDQTGRIPYKGFWEPKQSQNMKNIDELRAAAHAMATGAGADQAANCKTLLREILQTYLEQGFIKSDRSMLGASRSNAKVAGLIEGTFS